MEEGRKKAKPEDLALGWRAAFNILRNGALVIFVTGVQAPLSKEHLWWPAWLIGFWPEWQRTWISSRSNGTEEEAVSKIEVSAKLSGDFHERNTAVHDGSVDWAGMWTNKHQEKTIKYQKNYLNLKV